MATQRVQIFNLIKQKTGKEIVQAFLKSKNLHFSGTWDEVFDKRIAPALDNGEISEAELIDLLRDSEEYGNQHVFLYECTSETAINLFDRQRVNELLNQNDLLGLLTEPLVLELPETPTLADIRWDSATVDLSLTIKAIETKRYKELVSEIKEGFDVTLKYTWTPERVVNIAKLYRNGDLEIRIQSRSAKYAKELDEFWEQIGFILPKSSFREVSLEKLKGLLASNPESISEEIKINETMVENDKGTKVRAVTGGQEIDLSSEKAASGSLKNFYTEDKGFCSRANIWFKARENAPPSTETHVILSGQVNEFSFPANCSKADYVYVSDRIKQLNK